MKNILSFKEHNNSVGIVDLNTDEFINIMKNDNVFNPGDFKYFSPSNDYSYFTDDVRFFVCKIGKEIVGIAHIRKSPYVENQWWLSYLCIKEKSRNNKYASAMSEYIFKYFKENNLIFETSSYTEDGYVKLKPLFSKLALKYGVDFVDKELL